MCYENLLPFPIFFPHRRLNWIEIRVNFFYLITHRTRCNDLPWQKIIPRRSCSIAGKSQLRKSRRNTISCNVEQKGGKREEAAMCVRSMTMERAYIFIRRGEQEKKLKRETLE